MRLKRCHKYRYAKLFRLVKIETSFRFVVENYYRLLPNYCPFQRIHQSVNFNQYSML